MSISGKELVSTIYEKLLQFNKKKNNPSKIWTHVLNRHFNIWVANKHMKICSTLLVIREKKKRSQNGIPIAFSKMAKTKKKIASDVKNMEKLEL